MAVFGICLFLTPFCTDDRLPSVSKNRDETWQKVRFFLQYQKKMWRNFIEFFRWSSISRPGCIWSASHSISEKKGFESHAPARNKSLDWKKWVGPKPLPCEAPVLDAMWSAPCINTTPTHGTVFHCFGVTDVIWGKLMYTDCCCS